MPRMVARASLGCVARCSGTGRRRRGRDTRAMTAEPDDAVKRRGRPPATDSTDTWCTILDVSPRLFAERGYSAVTNKDLAAAAGVTTSALYHYVESKLDLYVA